jgi:starch synthase
MIKIFHISTECYPAAKVGGLGDVVGALPKYQNREGISASVIIPRYTTEWIQARTFDTVYKSAARMGDESFDFRVKKMRDNKLGFPLYVMDIPASFNRPGIYVDSGDGNGYSDNFERFLRFQIAVLEWFKNIDEPDLIHCHDHPTGLIPFMMTQSYRYSELQHIPTVFTVHNGEYHGAYDRSKHTLLPDFDEQNIGLLDWNGKLNSLAAGLKSCWQITTVSPSYMEELSQHENRGLEWLYQNEKQKSRGILNGIDTEVWDPKTDPMIEHHYDRTTVISGKEANKKALCDEFGLNSEYPTIAYIGRLAREKGTDLLPDLFQQFLDSSRKINFIILGTGDPQLHEQFTLLNQQFVGYFDATLDYNEPLAHRIYAGSDFMIIPSRVEPCGLNQMYAMRYGTVPIVREIGGLKDTVKDIRQDDGYGITFKGFSISEATEAINRAIKLFNDAGHLKTVRKKIMRLDFSWEASAREYIKLYRELIRK